MVTIKHGSQIIHIKMGWKTASYMLPDGKVVLDIEPMEGEPDILYIPQRADNGINIKELSNDIRSVSWNRDIRYEEVQDVAERKPFIYQEAIRGTLECTEAGKEFLKYDLFDLDKKVTKEQAHEL